MKQTYFWAAKRGTNKIALRKIRKIEICNYNTNILFPFCPNAFFNLSSSGFTKLSFFCVFVCVMFIYSGALAAQNNKKNKERKNASCWRRGVPTRQELRKQKQQQLHQ